MSEVARTQNRKKKKAPIPLHLYRYAFVQIQKIKYGACFTYKKERIPVYDFL